MTDEKVKQFLSKEVGLTARVIGLLPLTINEKSLEDIDLNSVLKLIQWRNKIVHALGDIPKGIETDVFADSFNNVLQLILLLSHKKRLWSLVKR